MTIQEAIEARHSVREYTEEVIPQEVRDSLAQIVDEINEESGLHIEICYDNPDGFDSKLAHYGRFRNVNNFIVLKGKDSPAFDEMCGYYGEKLVLEAQMLGLNTCWVYLTFNKKLVKKIIPAGEKLCMVISLGYGATQGVSRKSKTLEDVVLTKGKMPAWFKKGAEAALLAPTATNQQKFVLGMIGGEPAIRVSGKGICTKVDLGIVKYHFEAVTGRKVF